LSPVFGYDDAAPAIQSMLISDDSSKSSSKDHLKSIFYSRIQKTSLASNEIGQVGK
jgi:hypothetical protein